MPAMKSEPFGIALCEAIGLAPKDVQAITIRAEAGDILRVQVDLTPLLKPESIQRIKEILADSDEALAVSFQMAAERHQQQIKAMAMDAVAAEMIEARRAVTPRAQELVDELFDKGLQDKIKV